MNWIKSSASIMKLIHSSIMTLILLSGVLALLTGCATGDKETILPQDGPTMKAVYDNHFSGSRPLVVLKNSDIDPEPHQTQTQSVSFKRYPFKRSKSELPQFDLKGYTRDAYSEIQQIFPRLKNPTLVMYVFPHLSGDEKNPVPGYSTAFTLYEKTEFALPGEPEAGY